MGPSGIFSTASWTPISESPTGLQPYGSAHYPPPRRVKATGSGAERSAKTGIDFPEDGKHNHPRP